MFKGEPTADKRSSSFGAARLLSSGGPFSEIGRPYGGKLSPSGDVLAVFSAAREGYWSGRLLPSLPSGRNRVVLLNAALNQGLAVCDGIRHTVHDAAFHPSQSWMALATGNCDGGHFYDGETILWNWQTGERRSLWATSRFTMRCRFDGAGALTVLFSEATDEDGEGGCYRMAVEDVLARSARGPIQVDAQACNPQEAGWDDPEPRWQEQADPWGILPQLKASSFCPSFGVWDVAWWSDTELAVAADEPALTVHSLNYGLARRHEIPQGRGVQLLRVRNGLNLLHVISWQGPTAGEGRSQLMEVRGVRLTPWQDFDRAHLFSVGQDGCLLGRATGNFPDLVLKGQPVCLTTTHLGRFHVADHALHARGSQQNYFLAGDVPQPGEDKGLYTFGPRGSTKCMDWDAEGQRTHNLAAVCDGEQTFIRASCQEQPHVRHLHGFVDAFDVSAGWRKRWTWSAGSPVTALTTVPRNQPWVVLGTADSTLWMLDAVTGAVLDRLRLGDGRTSVVLTAMDCAPDGRRLAVGSADGRVWVVDLSGP